MTNIKNNNPHVVDGLTKKIGISTYPVFENQHIQSETGRKIVKKSASSHRKKSKYQEISVGKSVYAVTCIQRLPFLVLS
jgi:hypothetical protein